MTIDFHSFAGLYARALDTASHLLARGAEHAAAVGVSEADMLDWRLIDDMAPLRFQIMVVCNFPQQWLARAVDLPVPADVTDALDVAGFKDALARSKAFVTALKPEQFAGRDDVPLTVTLGNGLAPTLPAGQWVSVFATTNLFFHLSTAFGILRARGTPIGKVDLFAGGL